MIHSDTLCMLISVYFLDPDKQDASGMSPGDQAGIAIAVILSVALLGAAGYFGFTYWKKKQQGDMLPVQFTNPSFSDNQQPESATFDAKVIFGQEAQENGGY